MVHEGTRSASSQAEESTVKRDGRDLDRGCRTVLVLALGVALGVTIQPCLQIAYDYRRIVDDVSDAASTNLMSYTVQYCPINGLFKPFFLD